VNFHQIILARRGGGKRWMAIQDLGTTAQAVKVPASGFPDGQKPAMQPQARIWGSSYPTSRPAAT
jgi:hypothetical protein